MTIRLVGLSGSLQQPSKTDALIETTLQAIRARLEPEETVEVELVQVGSLGDELLGATSRAGAGPALSERLGAIEGADLLVVGSPVYKGTYTGLFKHVVDLLDQDSLIGVPVVLTATGGSDRHALVIEHQFRPLFSFFRAVTLPVGIYATGSAFTDGVVSSPEILQRIDDVSRHASAPFTGAIARPRIPV